MPKLIRRLIAFAPLMVALCMTQGCVAHTDGNGPVHGGGVYMGGAAGF